MDLRIKNKTALITGSGSGIGLATAKLLAKEGVNIILNDRTPKKLNKAEAEVQALARDKNSIHSIAADLTKNEDVLAMEKKAKEALGIVDIVVNCAGIHGASGEFLSLTDSDWWETFDTDLMGAVRVCRAFLPEMLKKGWGRVVLIASENALQPYEEDSPYNVCKAGIVNLTKCLSKAYSPKGVMINCVSPAFIATPMTDEMMEQKAKQLNISKEEAIQNFLAYNRPHIVVDRRGKPEEVAAVIAFLCSNSSSYVTGSNYRVDGGSIATSFG